MVDESLAVAPVRPPLVAELGRQERLPAPVLEAARLGAAVARVRHVDDRHRRRRPLCPWRRRPDRRRRTVSVGRGGDGCLRADNIVGRLTPTSCVDEIRRHL